MSWIQTYTGRAFWPLAPKPEDFDIRDIAHSLSLQCRFNGHCREFYSVAEHSLNVSRILSPEHALWGLLHDAGEAYLVDMPRPLKQQMPQFKAAEDRILQQLALHFGLCWPIPEEVHRADLLLLATEKRDLMTPEPMSWELGIEPLSWVITPISAQEAEQKFLEQFYALSKMAQPNI
jgi:hypothetical protein